MIAKHSDPEELQAAYTQWFKENKFQLGPLDRYKFIDKGGVYTGSQSVHNPGKDGYRYDVIHPETNQPCKQPLMGYRFKESTMQELIESDRILYGKDHNKIIELKLYAEEFEEKFSSIIELDGRIGANQLRELFPEMKTAFTNPKPVQLLEMLISYVCEGDDIILDFFAGSGTTPHAVMNLNNNEDAEYSFIAVQSPELSKEGSDPLKNGYQTVFDLTRERLIRADKKGRGFKVFETVANFRFTDDDRGVGLSNHTMFDDVLLTEEQYQTLLVTWSLYDGSELTTPITPIQLDDYTAHLCERRLYMIAPNFSSNALKALLHKLDNIDDENFDPNKIIFYANNFDSVKQMELNEAIRSYANKKSIEIDVVVRN